MKPPSLLHINQVLLFFILIGFILYYGQPLLVPLFFSILLGMLLLPVCNWLEKRGISRLTATFFALLFIVFFLGGIGYVLFAQSTNLVNQWPLIQQKLAQLIQVIQNYFDLEWGIGRTEQNNYFLEGISRISGAAGNLFSDFIDSLTSLLTGCILTLLYFFFLMWKREKYEHFILQITPAQERENVKKALAEITKVSSQYFSGRLVSMFFLAVVYSIGFTIMDIPHSILISLIAVIPTLVPYVGAFIGGFFPLIMVLIGENPSLFWPVCILLITAQIFDNNIIEPLAEGESLHIGPIWTIIALVLGELLWGIAGMILFMPMVAIIKIICSHLPRLEPYAYLLDNELGTPAIIKYASAVFTRKKNK